MFGLPGMPFGGPVRMAATVGMMGAGMAFGGAFAAGVLFGGATVGAALLARRAMQDRDGYSGSSAPSSSGTGSTDDLGAPTASQMMDAGTPLAGDSGLA